MKREEDFKRELDKDQFHHKLEIGIIYRKMARKRGVVYSCKAALGLPCSLAIKKGAGVESNNGTDTNEQRNILKKFLSSRAVHTIEEDVRPLRTFLTKFQHDWSMKLAGLLAYSLLMAMLPIAIALFAIVGFFLRNPGIHNRIVAQTEGIFPGLTARQNAVTLALEHLKNESGLLLLISIILALFLGSRLFIVIEECLDIIYRIHPRDFIRQNLVAIGMLLLFIVLIPTMVFVSTVPTLILSLLNEALYDRFSGTGLIFASGLLSGLLVSFILFEAIYMIVPNRRITFRHSWPGALVAAIALEIYLTLFPFYTAHFLTGVSGPVGFAIILLIFFYFFAVILLLGAEINAYFFEAISPIPSYLPSLISTIPGRLRQRMSRHRKTDRGPASTPDVKDKRTA